MMTSRIALTSMLGVATTTPVLADLPGTSELDVWEVLSEITVDEQVTETSYNVAKTFPTNFQSDVEGAEVTGYAMTLYPGETINELILVADMGLCPFCGNGGHGGNLLVTLAEPLTIFEEGTRITVQGTLARVDDPETWQAAVLKDAKVIVQ